MHRIVWNNMLKPVVIGSMAVVLLANCLEAYAQAEKQGSTTDKAQHEQDLREQLKGNLQEREHLLQ